jgi:hypothetical protein
MLNPGPRLIPLVAGLVGFLLAMKLVSGEPKDEIDARRILQRQELQYVEARAIVERHPRGD